MFCSFLRRPTYLQSCQSFHCFDWYYSGGTEIIPEAMNGEWSLESIPASGISGTNSVRTMGHETPLLNDGLHDLVERIEMKKAL